MTIGGQSGSPKQLGSSSDGESLTISNEDGTTSGVANVTPPSNTLNLWIDVANGIDKSQTGEPARLFVELLFFNFSSVLRMT